VGKSIFKKKKYFLAVKESDVRFSFAPSGRLNQIRISANKIIEMRENGLLDPDKIHMYSGIVLVHDRKTLRIPVVRGSGKFCGQNSGLLRFAISPNVFLRKGELHNWHLQLSQDSKNHEKGA
jgi:hypothetical protein